MKMGWPVRENKNWILPDGKVVNAGPLHSRWLVSNPKVAKRFGVDLAGLTPENDDQEIRLLALKAGFARLNYVVREWDADHRGLPEILEPQDEGRDLELCGRPCG